MLSRRQASCLPVELCARARKTIFTVIVWVVGLLFSETGDAAARLAASRAAATATSSDMLVGFRLFGSGITSGLTGVFTKPTEVGFVRCRWREGLGKGW